MVQDLISVVCDGNTIQDEIDITINITNGTFVLTPTGYITVESGGVPPGTNPRAAYIVYVNQLIFKGKINSVNSDLFVQSNDNFLSGKISVNTALPVPVTISSLAGKGSATLPPGQTIITFNIPIANAPAESEAERASRIARTE